MYYNLQLQTHAFCIYLTFSFREMLTQNIYNNFKKQTLYIIGLMFFFHIDINYMDPDDPSSKGAFASRNQVTISPFPLTLIVPRHVKRYPRTLRICATSCVT